MQRRVFFFFPFAEKQAEDVFNFTNCAGYVLFIGKSVSVERPRNVDVREDFN